LKIWLYALWWGFPRLIFGRRCQLWAPLPTLATHMESTCLSPLVDWHTMFVKFQLENQAQWTIHGK
jgi:hypothetical protein